MWKVNSLLFDLTTIIWTYRPQSLFSTQITNLRLYYQHHPSGLATQKKLTLYCIKPNMLWDGHNCLVFTYCYCKHQIPIWHDWSHQLKQINYNITRNINRLHWNWILSLSLSNNFPCWFQCMFSNARLPYMTPASSQFRNLNTSEYWSFESSSLASRGEICFDKWSHDHRNSDDLIILLYTSVYGMWAMARLYANNSMILSKDFFVFVEQMFVLISCHDFIGFQCSNSLSTSAAILLMNIQNLWYIFLIDTVICFVIF